MIQSSKYAAMVMLSSLNVESGGFNTLVKILVIGKFEIFLMARRHWNCAVRVLQVNFCEICKRSD